LNQVCFAKIFAKVRRTVGLRNYSWCACVFSKVGWSDWPTSFPIFFIRMF